VLNRGEKDIVEMKIPVDDGRGPLFQPLSHGSILCGKSLNNLPNALWYAGSKSFEKGIDALDVAVLCNV
jgi:hypothetical protein